MASQSDPKSVRHFREILFLPLQVDAEALGLDDWPAICGELTRQLGQEWKKQDGWYSRPYLDAPAASIESHREQTKEAEKDARFSEFVYFQPYVQRLLYGVSEGEDQAAAVVVYCRDDVQGVDVQLRPSDETIRLAVGQLSLLWFHLGGRHGIALLVLEVALPESEPLSLSLAQDFLDRFRRLYPPYWADFKTPPEPGRFPHRVSWQLRDGRARESVCLREDYRKLRDETEGKRQSPLADHWCWLLNPAGADLLGNNKCLRQIEDERMPTMAFLAFDNPRALSRGDFIRLCLADDPGASDTLPYAPDFLADFESRHCYERFWDADGLRKGTDWLTTRHMNCGYAYTLVGSNGNSFFMDRDNGALSHFRRHYLTMGLLTHFQRAALLSFSDQLSEALTRHGKDTDRFREAAEGTLKQILDFTDRYWFPEISTQLQAREMNALWRKHLNLQELYDQVMHEAREVSRFLDSKARDRQTEEAKRTSDRIGRAGVLMGLAAALASGIFGLFTDGTRPQFENPFSLMNLGNALFNAVLGLGVAFAVIFLAIGLLPHFVKRVWPDDQQ